ncbi:MAG: uroporphyrinogen decarboxylase [Candidatus Binatus sp.]|uniref:uroporphyrinogen decarboxylase n=1 Tax=Candidatus Binatus sp. TaxID=2811406 RepID=UPI0027256F67|nr:uroporphyrinogen decarboxylase [Candidatus Binatus sp.]MDO8433683.1 uroporphyrinogen decarboxylase [Candidatus Binatus sp.]
MIERRGGVAIIAPAMREIPLEDNRAALEFADRLLAGGFELVIFLTGVGARALFQAIETRHPRGLIVEALKKVTTVARGPKPIRAMRELGLEPTIVVPEPNTWREILNSVSARGDLNGQRVAIQEYGASNRELIAGLEARGAIVTVVPVYRWALPIDRAPLRAALEQIAAGEAEVALFTSSNQVTNVIQMAEADGIGADVMRGFSRMAVGSIGPVCSEQLRAYGIAVDFEPQHSKLGHFVNEAAARAASILASKYRAPRIEVVEVPIRRRVASAPPIRSPLHDHPMMKACRREAAPYTPIWLMRQAGRYMPEYRRVRERHDFLEMCRQPELAAEVTVTAVERLGVDAAIIFADILLPLIPMAVGLHFEKGDGPIIDRPIRSAADLDRIPPIDPDALNFVGESIKLVKSALANKTPLIGFAGAPFTLASYLIEGGSSRQYQATKTFMYTQPEVWHRLMEMLARITADYLKMQIAAGADIVQIFDSWVGSLGPDDFRRFVLPHTAAVIAAIPAEVPVIHFGTVTGNLLELMRAAGGDVLGLDWRVNLAEAWARLNYSVAVQGNLDPVALFADVPEIRTRARAILDQAGCRAGHIFNLGHGILPETPVDHVIALVDAVHEMSARH